MTLPNRKSRKRLGADGEAVAKSHLERLGWTILTTNFRSAQGEIDLIAEEATSEGPVLIFAEVKTRQGTTHGTPIEAVDERKQRKVFATAQAYLSQRGAEGEEPACRFDIIEVFADHDGLMRVVVHPGAFGL